MFEIDGVIGSQRKISISYESDLEINLKGLGCENRFLQPFFIKFPSNNENMSLFL